MTTASLNFTNRAKIKSKFVSITILERNDLYVRVKCAIEKGAVGSNTGAKLVLDAFERDNHERKEIPDFGTHNFDFENLSTEGKIKFRVRHVAVGTEVGRILASTAEIVPEELNGTNERVPFFKPTPVELGSLPWKIDWAADTSNPELLINKDLIEHFDDWRSPALQALYLPAALKDLLTGIMSRVTSFEDIDNESMIYNLFNFCESRLGQEMPQNLAFNANGELSDDWLNWADECVLSFCETQWRHNKTLFEQMRGD